MNSLISDLVTYVESGPASGILEKAAAALESGRLRIVAIKILFWMKERAIIGRYKPLVWKKEHEWVANFVRLHQLFPEFADVFQVSDRCLDFSPSITPQERSEILAFVHASYHPTLRE